MLRNFVVFSSNRLHFKLIGSDIQLRKESETDFVHGMFPTSFPMVPLMVPLVIPSIYIREVLIFMRFLFYHFRFRSFASRSIFIIPIFLILLSANFVKGDDDDDDDDKPKKPRIAPGKKLNPNQVKGNPNNKKVSYSKDIQPILENSCYRCHNAKKAKKRINLQSSFAGVSRLVVPGNPEKSLLYKSMIGKGAKLMPPKNPLDESDIELVKNWIKQGAKQN